jgi:L-seryl-tRNA(Ser) seleniumtransferase
MAANPLRHIPSVTELLETPRLKGLVDRVSHNVVVSSVRTYLDKLRADLRTAAADMRLPSPSELAEKIARRILQEERPTLRPVINATGILLHTGLGRAPLAEAAIEDLVAVGRDYASVELDLDSGQRSQRVVAVEGLLRQITGAEAACVVNNNAGATLLTLAAIAAGKDVITSRGQLIEIGGSFRLPDVMAASGATLREVGTTNKTRLKDYEQAICDRTAALLHVHTSNFRVVGFTEEVPLADLVSLGRKHRLPVIHDIGSGALVDFAQFGFHGEPIAADSIRDGADLVLFSGDKLLGGPQCGIIVGRRDLVQRIASHPLMRALRVDKLTFAALAATLRIYRDPEKAREEIPLLHLLGTSIENLKDRAERLAPQMAGASAVKEAHAVADVTYLGGGSIPAQQMPTWCVSLAPREMGVDQFARALRLGAPAVIGRVKEGRLLLDLRSVPPRQDRLLVSAVEALSAPKRESGADGSDGAKEFAI